jgi:hypothetical protein
MEEFATIAGNGHARGRRVRQLPRHVFKDSGIEVELRKLGPTTLQRITEAIRRECMALPAGAEHKYPEAPREVVSVGGEDREEVNERHPDHLEALERWSRWALNQINERYMRIAAVDAVFPVDMGEDEIAEEVRRVRRVLSAEGVDLPYFDQYTPEENDKIVWLQHVACATREDMNELYTALLNRTTVTEEAVAAHVATFPAAE